jgi:hypothetical protein
VDLGSDVRATELAWDTFADVETRVRLRLNDVEVECVGDEAFVVDRLPQLVAELIRLLTGQVPSLPAPAQAIVPDPPAGPHPAPVATSGPALANIAGVIHDYFSDVVVPGARVQTVGLNPELEADADEAGRFVMSGQTGGNGLIVVTGLDNYVKTTTGLLALSGVSSQVVPVVARADLNAMNAALGLVPNLNSSTVFVQLLTATGDPLQEVAATDITLKQGGIAVGDGAYFFGPSGFVDPSMVLSQAFGTSLQARAAFFNVPAGATDLALQVGGALTTVPLLVLPAAVTVAQAQLPT